MPNQMTIHIDVNQANQTVSKFAVDEKGQITFQNDAGASANVNFEGTSPVCQGNNKKQSFDINAGASKKWKLCDDAAGQQFKYTATVAGATPEDPILIIERKTVVPPVDTKPIFFPEGIPMLLVGALIGAVIGYLVAKRLTSRTR